MFKEKYSWINRPPFFPYKWTSLSKIGEHCEQCQNVFNKVVNFLKQDAVREYLGFVFKKLCEDMGSFQSSVSCFSLIFD